MKTREPLTDLAAIVGAMNAAAQEHARVGDLLDALDRAEIFESVVALGCNEGSKRFIALQERGDRTSVAGFKSWPLRRLFETMRVRRISLPDSTLSALAIPLDYGVERTVVLATLSSWAYDAEFEPFFRALENFVVTPCASRLLIPDNIPLAPIEPRVISFALCSSRNAAVDDVLSKRGWCTRLANNFVALRAVLQSARPEVIFMDLDHQPDPSRALLRLHDYITGPIKVIAFGHDSFRSWESQTLVDAVIAHDASEDEIFAVLKRFTREVPKLRRTRFREMTLGLEIALRDCKTPAELSALGARHAAEVMLGWASMHLVMENGATFASEYPELPRAVLAGIPKAFLSDEPLFQIHADERFYQEVSDDRRAVGALERLQPISAASIPLHHGSRRIGTLVSVSQNAAVDSSAFQALEDFARIATRRFQEFAQPIPEPVAERNGVWESLRHGMLEFAAYRSEESPMAWDYRAIRPDFGLLVVGDEIDLPSLKRDRMASRSIEQQLAAFVEQRTSNERIFVAACDPLAMTVTYAAHGFPAPLLFDALGPAGMVSARGPVVRGTVTIPRPAGLLVWDAHLQRELLRETADVRSVTEILEDQRPPGIAVVVTAAR